MFGPVALAAAAVLDVSCKFVDETNVTPAGAETILDEQAEVSE